MKPVFANGSHHKNTNRPVLEPWFARSCRGRPVLQPDFGDVEIDPCRQGLVSLQCSFRERFQPDGELLRGHQSQDDLRRDLRSWFCIFGSPGSPGVVDVPRPAADAEPLTVREEGGTDHDPGSQVAGQSQE